MESPVYSALLPPLCEAGTAIASRSAVIIAMTTKLLAIVVAAAIVSNGNLCP